MDLPLWIEKARRGISIYPEDTRMVEAYSMGKTWAADVLIVVGVLVALWIIGYYYLVM